MKRIIALALASLALAANAQTNSLSYTNTAPKPNDGGATFFALVTMEAITGVCVYFYVKATVKAPLTNQLALVTVWRSTNAVNWVMLSQDVIPADEVPHSTGGDSWYANRALYKIKARPFTGDWTP